MKRQRKTTLAKRGAFTSPSVSGFLRRRPAILRGRFGTALAALCASALPLLASSVANAQTFPPDSQWLPLTKNGVPIGDPQGDGQNSRDIVGDSTAVPPIPAAYVYSDGTYLYFRLRLAANPYQVAPNFQQFGWTCLIDTNGDTTQSYEFAAGVDGISDLVELRQNSTFTQVNNPAEVAEILLQSYSVATNAQANPTTTTLGGGTDYFIDWAVALADFPMGAITPTTPLVFICGSSSNARNLTADPISESGASTLTDLSPDPITCDATGCHAACVQGAGCATGLNGACATGTWDCSGMTPVCTPTVQPGQLPEMCNSVDDNCDGTIDEGYNLGNSCTNGLGICQTSGTTVCDGMGGAFCDAVPGVPQAETCNGLDDNCNGAADEGFGLGTSCSVGVGACTNTGVVICDGSGGTTCDAVPGMPQTETCNNIDDDCDGSVDNGNPGGGMSCSTGLNGVCDAGTTNCAAGGMLDCVPNVTPGSQMETCNGLDDNCDGVSDEGFNLGMSCTNGLGICMATGQIICDGMGGALCDAVPGTPQQEICGDMLDSDCDGNLDNGCLDSDGDGIFDDVEILYGTDPNDADSDDDGIIDGEEPNWNQDSDGDGLINALDPDSDNDGLFDGTEVGKDCSNPATDLSQNHCIADADMGQTTTDPLDADTDDGGVMDGAEDKNQDGKVDTGETDPTAGNGADDATKTDTDGDGIPDDVEILIGSDPNDADSDDDGILDGQEPNWTDDTDRDGLINVLDPDSDNDGLFDGTEVGKDCSNPATDTTKGHCIADGDMGQTTTSPLDPDTDDGGVMDGAEDKNHNGTVDMGETDPTEGNGGDDTLNVDTDGDGIPDDVEILIGTDPNDADSDDDGVKDGDEPNWSDDTDGDGTINPLDPDSDNDGIFDGTEMGKDCSDPATDTTKMHCIPDGDQGQTTTSPVDPDTDDGGELDGDEDKNHNGVLDAGETDPTKGHGADDMPPQCKADNDCGGPTSGKVCDPSTETCIDGCRGTNGNGCPTGEVCSSTDDTIGTCMAGTGGAGGTGGMPGTGGMGGMPGTGGAGGAGGAEPLGIVVQGNGIVCSARPTSETGSMAWMLGVAIGALAVARRKRR